MCTNAVLSPLDATTISAEIERETEKQRQIIIRFEERSQQKENRRCEVFVQCSHEFEYTIYTYAERR